MISCYICSKANLKVQKVGTYLNVLVPNCTWTNKGSDYTTYGSPMPMRRNLVQCSVVSDTTINQVYSLNDTFNGSGNLGSFTGAIGTTVANPSSTELEASSNTGYPVISAVISTVPGKEYTVSTDYNNATFVGGYTESVYCEVIEGGITVASQSMTMTGSTYSFNYTAGAGSASIRYTYVLTPNPGPPPPPALPPYLFAIDNVKVYYLDTSIVNDTVCESKSGYRYGFNGMEKVDEISGEGNDYDFGARIYDGRLGRWFSVDKYVISYPNVSPYNYSINCPIHVIDVDGNVINLVNENTKTKFESHITNITGPKVAKLFIEKIANNGQISKKELRKATRGLTKDQKRIAREYASQINDVKVINLQIGKANENAAIPGSSNTTNKKTIGEVTSNSLYGTNSTDENGQMNIFINEDFNFASQNLWVVDPNTGFVADSESKDEKDNGNPLENDKVSINTSIDEAISSSIIGKNNPISMAKTVNTVRSILGKSNTNVSMLNFIFSTGKSTKEFEDNLTITEVITKENDNINSPILKKSTYTEKGDHIKK